MSLELNVDGHRAALSNAASLLKSSMEKLNEKNLQEDVVSALAGDDAKSQDLSEKESEISKSTSVNTNTSKVEQGTFDKTTCLDKTAKRLAVIENAIALIKTKAAQLKNSVESDELNTSKSDVVTVSDGAVDINVTITALNDSVESNGANQEVSDIEQETNENEAVSEQLSSDNIGNEIVFPNSISSIDDKLNDEQKEDEKAETVSENEKSNHITSDEIEAVEIEPDVVKNDEVSNQADFISDIETTLVPNSDVQAQLTDSDCDFNAVSNIDDSVFADTAVQNSNVNLVNDVQSDDSDLINSVQNADENQSSEMISDCNTPIVENTNLITAEEIQLLLNQGKILPITREELCASGIILPAYSDDGTLLNQQELIAAGVTLPPVTADEMAQLINSGVIIPNLNTQQPLTDETAYNPNNQSSKGECAAEYYNSPSISESEAEEYAAEKEVDDIFSKDTYNIGSTQINNYLPGAGVDDNKITYDSEGKTTSVNYSSPSQVYNDDSVAFETLDEKAVQTQTSQGEPTVQEKIENKEDVDTEMAHEMAEEMYDGNTHVDAKELVGLSFDSAMDILSEAYSTQMYSSMVYLTNISRNTDSTTVEENQKAVSEFMSAYNQVFEKANANNIEFLTLADETTFSAAANVAKRLEDNNYVLTREIMSAKSKIDSVRFTVVEKDKTSDEQKYNKLGFDILHQLEKLITKGDHTEDNSADFILTKMEYYELEDSFVKSDDKFDAYNKLVEDAKKYGIMKSKAAA